jgi:hypothetical protein
MPGFVIPKLSMASVYCYIMCYSALRLQIMPSSKKCSDNVCPTEPDYDPAYKYDMLYDTLMSPLRKLS